MSFILDALKKLEQKRHRGSVPDLMTVHIPSPEAPRKRPVWLYLLLAALVINAAVLTVLFIPKKDKEAKVTQIKEAGIESPKRSVPVKSPTDTVKETEQSPRNETKEKREEPVTEAPKAVKKQPVKQETIKEASVRKVPAVSSSNTSAPEVSAPVVQTPPSPPPANYEKGIPDINQLSPDMQMQIPKINILGHIYSDSSTTRMVNLNGNIFREGDSLQKDLRVVEITQNAVIFDFRGTIFRIRAF